MLDVAGMLDRRLYGVPVPMARRADGEVTVADGNNDRRRSIYMQVLRSNPLTMLQSHDQPVMETNCTRRTRSTVSTQALTLLNDPFAIGMARTLAGRLEREAGPAMAARVERAFALALQRALADHGHPAPAEAVVRRMIGRGSPMLVQRASDHLGLGLDATAQAALVETFFHHYGRLQAVDECAAQPYPGAREGLAALHAAGLPLAVVTNKQHRFACGLLQRLVLQYAVIVIYMHQQEVTHRRSRKYKEDELRQKLIKRR